MCQVQGQGKQLIIRQKNSLTKAQAQDKTNATTSSDPHVEIATPKEKGKDVKVLNQRMNKNI